MINTTRTALELKLFTDVCKRFNIIQVDCRLIILIGLRTVKIAELVHFGMHYKLTNILKRGYVIKPYPVRKQYRCSDKGIEVYKYFIAEMERINTLISTQGEGNKIDLI